MKYIEIHEFFIEKKTVTYDVQNIKKNKVKNSYNDGIFFSLSEKSKKK